MYSWFKSAGHMTDLVHAVAKPAAQDAGLIQAAELDAAAPQADAQPASALESDEDSARAERNEEEEGEEEDEEEEEEVEPVSTGLYSRVCFGERGHGLVATRAIGEGEVFLPDASDSCNLERVFRISGRRSFPVLRYAGLGAGGRARYVTRKSL